MNTIQPLQFKMISMYNLGVKGKVFKALTDNFLKALERSNSEYADIIKGLVELGAIKIVYVEDILNAFNNLSKLDYDPLFLVRNKTKGLISYFDRNDELVYVLVPPKKTNFTMNLDTTIKLILHMLMHFAASLKPQLFYKIWTPVLKKFIPRVIVSFISNYLKKFNAKLNESTMVYVVASVASDFNKLLAAQKSWEEYMLDEINSLKKMWLEIVSNIGELFISKARKGKIVLNEEQARTFKTDIIQFFEDCLNNILSKDTAKIADWLQTKNGRLLRQCLLDSYTFIGIENVKKYFVPYQEMFISSEVAAVAAYLNKYQELVKKSLKLIK